MELTTFRSLAMLIMKKTKVRRTISTLKEALKEALNLELQLYAVFSEVVLLCLKNSA